MKLPTVWTDGQAEVGSVREEKRREEARRSEKRKSQKKEDAGTRKGRKVAIRCVFPIFLCSGGSKSRHAKAAGAEPSRQMRDDKLHAVVARGIFPSQKCKKTDSLGAFVEVEMWKDVRAATEALFSGQRLHKLTVSVHCWKLRCRKNARRCGPKHMSKSKVLRTESFGALLEVDMSKKCTPLWREAMSK